MPSYKLTMYAILSDDVLQGEKECVPAPVFQIEKRLR